MIIFAYCGLGRLIIIFFLITSMNEKSQGEISPQKMLKQAQKTKGYLHKKSNGILSTWKQQYFIIFNGALAYYGDEALDKQKGEIKIKDIEGIAMRGQVIFTLRTAKKQYEFRCSNQQDRDLWVASLNLLKEYVTEGEFTKKILIKKAQVDNKVDRFQLCRLDDIRQVLQLMKLTLLADQVEESRIHNRIYCQKLSNEYYVSISIKCLQFPEVDEEILNQKYIIPYNFNKLYKLTPDGKVEDVAKMSQMQSLKSQDGSVVILFSDKKKILIPYRNESEAYEISRKLCRCYEVAKEYYNSFKIVLKKNIDRLVYLYDHFRPLFDQQTIYRANQHLKRYINCSTNTVEAFLGGFKSVKRDLIETEEACRVISPPREDLKCAYFKLVHQQTRNALARAWQTLFAAFDLKNLILFSAQLYQYWIVVNQVVSDSTLLQGCCDLNQFFMGRAGEAIKQKMQSFTAQKVQHLKVKSEPVGNELTSVFLEWMKQINSYLTETVPLETIFDRYCLFYTKCIDEFLEFLCDISEKWTETLVIIGACNDLSKIRKYFKTNVGSELCKGIFAEKKFYAICGNEILKKVNESLSNLIRKAFIIFFRNIDKRLLTKPFLEIDFSKICYEVLQRLEPYKNKLLEDVEYQMYILSFDEICFFFYTILTNKNIPSIKNVKEYYINAIDKGLTDIQQYYCNIKTETYVKNYLKQLTGLKQILICPEASLPKVVSDLHRTFGTSFSKETIATLLNIRQVNQQFLKMLLEQCLKGLNKSPSSQDSQSYQQVHMRSRKSTLTQSLYTISIPESRSTFTKMGKQGYLQMKKVVKGISNFFNRSYFRIKDGHMLEYYSPNSTEIISSIDLDDVEYCYLDSQNNEKCTFIMIVGSTTYHFKDTTRDEAGLWIQAIYSEIKHPLFENKNQCSEKDRKNALFKNLQTQLATTCTNKRKTGQNLQEQKFFEFKRTRRIKGVQQNQKSTNKVSQQSPPKRSVQKKGKSSKPQPREDEGTCCTGKIF